MVYTYSVKMADKNLKINALSTLSRLDTIARRCDIVCVNAALGRAAKIHRPAPFDSPGSMNKEGGKGPAMGHPRRIADHSGLGVRPGPELEA
jgi:hypothetical protein